MPLPLARPAVVQVPARAGVGLQFRPRTADPCWPADWWQRNYDELECECEPCPPCPRWLRIPPPPETEVTP